MDHDCTSARVIGCEVDFPHFKCKLQVPGPGLFLLFAAWAYFECRMAPRGQIQHGGMLLPNAMHTAVEKHQHQKAAPAPACSLWLVVVVVAAWACAWGWGAMLLPNAKCNAHCRLQFKNTSTRTPEHQNGRPAERNGSGSASLERQIAAARRCAPTPTPLWTVEEEIRL